MLTRYGGLPPLGCRGLVIRDPSYLQLSNKHLAEAVAPTQAPAYGLARRQQSWEL
jgi:hypothetical protein